MASTPEHWAATRFLTLFLLTTYLVVPVGSETMQLEYRAGILHPPAKVSPMCAGSNVEVMQLRQLNHILSAHNFAAPSKDRALRNCSVEDQALPQKSGRKEGSKWKWRDFESAKEQVQRQSFSKRSEFWSWKERPADIPYNPNHTYKRRGWIGWADFLRGSDQDGDLMSDEQRRSCDVCRHRVASYGEVSIDLRHWSKFLCHQCALSQLELKSQRKHADEQRQSLPLPAIREQSPSRNRSPSLSSWSADSEPLSSPSDALHDPSSDSLPSSRASPSSPSASPPPILLSSSPTRNTLCAPLPRSPSPSTSSLPDPLDAPTLPPSSSAFRSSWAPQRARSPPPSPPTPRTLSPERQLRRASRQPLRAAAIVRLVRRCRDCPQLACFGPPLNLKSRVGRAGRGRVGRRAVHCKRHALESEVDVVHVTKCREHGCARTPSFGEVGGRAEFCKLHRKVGQAGVVGYRCRFPEGCGLRASFGDARTGLPSFCCRHKSSAHIDLLSRKCRHPEGCSLQASFPTTGGGDLRQFCRKHDRETADRLSPVEGVG